MYNVYTPSDFAFALAYCGDGTIINILNDLDMNGAAYVIPGKAWSNVTLNGNGHTIYNINGSRDNFSGLCTTAVYSHVNSLTVSHAKFYGTGSHFGLLPNNSGYDWNIRNYYNNSIIEDSLIGGTSTSACVGAFGGCGSYQANNCGAVRVTCIGGYHVGNFFGLFEPTLTVDCYAVDGLTVNYGGHGGGFVSCSDAGGRFYRCFSNVTCYGTADMGGMCSGCDTTGDNNGGYTTICYYEDCFTSGVVESDLYAGGFFGNENHASGRYTILTNCYSTAMVGMNYGAQYQGGFVGVAHCGNVYRNCYAAGEVGSIDTNYATATTIGGFVGQYTVGTFQNCYYDMQTSAMKNKGIGNAGLFTLQRTADGVKTNTVSGVTGMTTAMLVKNSALGSGYALKNGMYPQFASFVSASDTYKAYSTASVATVFCDDWSDISSTGFDTIRDIIRPLAFTSILPFTNNTQFQEAYADASGMSAIDWSTDGTNSLATGEPIVSLSGSAPYYTLSLNPGIEWMTVTTNCNGVIGSRRLRIIPTSVLMVGDDTLLNVYQNASKSDTYTAMGSFSTTYVEKNVLQSLQSAGTLNNSYVKKYSDMTGEALSNGSVVGNIALPFNQIEKNLSIEISLYANDGTKVNLNENSFYQKLKGQTKFAASDADIYTVTYKSILSDGRYLEDSKAINIIVPYAVTYFYNYEGRFGSKQIKKTSVFYSQYDLDDFDHGFDMYAYGTEPVRDGYTFAFWSLDPYGNKKVDQSFFDTYSQVYGELDTNIQLYANWDKIREPESVTVIDVLTDSDGNSQFLTNSEKKIYAYGSTAHGSDWGTEADYDGTYGKYVYAGDSSIDITVEPIDDSAFVVDNDFSHKDTVVGYQDVNFSNIINNWEKFGAPIWSSTGEYIYGSVKGSAGTSGGSPTSGIQNYSGYKFSQVPTSITSVDNSWWGSAIINPDAYDATNLDIEFQVEANGNLRNGFCFNVTKNADGTLNGYFFDMTNHVGWVETRNGPITNWVYNDGNNNGYGTYRLTLWKFDHWQPDKPFDGYLWCAIGADGSNPPSYAWHGESTWAPGTVMTQGSCTMTSLAQWRIPRQPEKLVTYNVKYENNHIVITADGQTVVDLSDSMYQYGSYGFWGFNCERTESMRISKFAAYTSRDYYTYRLQVNPNGGTYKYQTTSVIEDSNSLKTIALETPTREGYTFAGWVKGPNFHGILEDNIYTYAESDTADCIVASWIPNIVYRYWIDKVYTLVYDANKPSRASSQTQGSMADETKIPWSSNHVLANNKYSLTGWTFKGWSLTPGNDSTLDYYNKQVVNNKTDEKLSDEANAVITLYAVWQENEYDIIFDKNNDSGTVTGSTPSLLHVKYEDFVQLPLNGFERTSPVNMEYRDGEWRNMPSTFLGWNYSTDDGQTVVFIDGETVSKLSPTNNSVVTLYAVWDDVPTFNVTAEFPDRYFTVLEAQNGAITEDELLRTLTTSDREGIRSVELVGYNADDYKSVSGPCVMTQTYKVTDTYGHYTYITINVHILENDTVRSSDEQVVRLYDRDYYKYEDGTFVSAENGGLAATSRWLTDDAYNALLRDTIYRTDTHDGKLYSFSIQDITHIRENALKHGIGSIGDESLAQKFLDNVKPHQK